MKWHWACPRSQCMCPPCPHCSGSRLLLWEPSKAGPGLHAPPRSKPLRFRYSGSPQRCRLGWACVLCPSHKDRGWNCFFRRSPSVGSFLKLPGGLPVYFLLTAGWPLRVSADSLGFLDTPHRPAPALTTRCLYPVEGGVGPVPAPPTSGCAPRVLLFHWSTASLPIQSGCLLSPGFSSSPP